MGPAPAGPVATHNGIKGLYPALGLLLNIPKSNLVPIKDFVFLGIHFQIVPYIWRPSRDRWRRLLALLRRFLKVTALPAGQWMSLVGSLTSMDWRPIQLSLMGRWNRKHHSLSKRIKVTTEDKVHLWWWARPSNVMSGQTLTPFKTQFKSSVHGRLKKGTGSSHE